MKKSPYFGGLQGKKLARILDMNIYIIIYHTTVYIFFIKIGKF